MGRYPFLSASKAYLVEVRHYYRPTSLAEIGRKLRYLARIFAGLRHDAIARGEISFSTNPVSMGEREVAAFLGWMKGRGLDPATQHKLVGILGGLLDWAGNGILRQMKARKRFRIVVPPKILYALSQDDLERIRSAADTIEGWRGDVVRFLVNVLPFCGLRPKEIRLARLQDVDTTRWTILVSHPKGEGAWAGVEIAPILPPARQAVRDFIVARADYLRSRGLDPDRVEVLMPYVSVRSGRVGPWDDSVLIRLKCDVAKAAGGAFDLSSTRAAAVGLQTAAGRFDAEAPPAAPEAIAARNRLLVRVTHALNSTLYTAAGRFRQDPAAAMPILPLLARTGELAKLPNNSDAFGFLEADLIRGRNAVEATLREAIEAIRN